MIIHTLQGRIPRIFVFVFCFSFLEFIPNLLPRRLHHTTAGNFITTSPSSLPTHRLHQSSSIVGLKLVGADATIREKEFLISNLPKSEKVLVESAIVGMVLDHPFSLPLPSIIMLFLEASFMELRILKLLGWSSTVPSLIWLI